jgi:hypothetical protein
VISSGERAAQVTGTGSTRGVRLVGLVLLVLHTLAIASAVSSTLLRAELSVQVWRFSGWGLVVLALMSLICGGAMLALGVHRANRRDSEWAAVVLGVNVLPYGMLILAAWLIGM